jgi:hypothetical protein
MNLQRISFFSTPAWNILAPVKHFASYVQDEGTKTWRDVTYMKSAHYCPSSIKTGTCHQVLPIYTFTRDKAYLIRELIPFSLLTMSMQTLRSALSRGVYTVGTSHPSRLRTEADPASETLCSLEYLTTNRAPKLSKYPIHDRMIGSEI